MSTKPHPITRRVKILAPPFTTTVTFEDGIVVRAAPVIKYMIGWTRDRVLAHVTRNGWKVGAEDIRRGN